MVATRRLSDFIRQTAIAPVRSPGAAALPLGDIGRTDTRAMRPERTKSVQTGLSNRSGVLALHSTSNRLHSNAKNSAL